jgi:hypothetical protein
MPVVPDAFRKDTTLVRAHIAALQRSFSGVLVDSPCSIRRMPPSDFALYQLLGGRARSDEGALKRP